MLAILSMILIVAMIIIMGIILRDASRGVADLLSLRNMFFAGLFVFQFTSGIIAMLAYDYTNPFIITDRTGVAFIFTVMLLGFVALFLMIYRSGFIADRISNMIKRPPLRVGWTQLLVLALLSFGLGLVCRFVLIYIPYFGIFALHFGAAFLSLATALAAWAWAPRLWNPIPALVTGFVMFGGMIALLSDSYGRRDIVGIGLALVWGAYYSHWRYLPFRAMLTRFAVVGAVGIIGLGAYTSTRFAFGKDIASVGTRISLLAQADLKQGVIDIFSGQNAGMYSLYFLKTRPDPFEYDTLHSLKLFLTLPVPRAGWAAKPNGLSLTSVDEIDSTGYPEGFNIGPGLVGHMANDNPLLAFPLYTLILAVSLRLADRLLTRYAVDPFIVLPFGVALGQVIAVPRGELGTFYAKTLLYIVAGWIAMQAVGSIFKLFSTFEAPPEDEWDEGYDTSYYDDDAYDDWDGSDAYDDEYTQPEPAGS